MSPSPAFAGSAGRPSRRFGRVPADLDDADAKTTQPGEGSREHPRARRMERSTLLQREAHRDLDPALHGIRTSPTRLEDPRLDRLRGRLVEDGRARAAIHLHLADVTVLENLDGEQSGPLEPPGPWRTGGRTAAGCSGTWEGGTRAALPPSRDRAGWHRSALAPAPESAPPPPPGTSTIPASSRFPFRTSTAARPSRHEASPRSRLACWPGTPVY